MEEYGERVRRLREALGLSQSQFAQKLGIHKQMVSDVERGRQKRFNPETEKALADLFDINLSWLLDGKGEMFLHKQVNDQDDISLEKELIMKYFDQILPENRLEATLCILECIKKYR